MSTEASVPLAGRQAELPTWGLLNLLLGARSSAMLLLRIQAATLQTAEQQQLAALQVSPLWSQLLLWHQPTPRWPAR
jgi:hypothetical protein